MWLKVDRPSSDDLSHKLATANGLIGGGSRRLGTFGAGDLPDALSVLWPVDPVFSMYDCDIG